MRVNEAQTHRLLDSECLWKGFDKALEVVFTFRIRVVIHKDDSLSVLLHRRPAFLVLEITTDVPELNVNLTKVLCHGTWWVSLEIDDAAACRWSVNGRNTFLKITKDVGDGALAGPAWSN